MSVDSSTTKLSAEAVASLDFTCSAKFSDIYEIQGITLLLSSKLFILRIDFFLRLVIFLSALNPKIQVDISCQMLHGWYLNVFWHCRFCIWPVLYNRANRKFAHHSHRHQTDSSILRALFLPSLLMLWLFLLACVTSLVFSSFSHPLRHRA